MDNRPFYEEINIEINGLNNELERLTEQVRDFKDNDKAPAPPTTRVDALLLKTNTGLFDEEEQSLISQIEGLSFDATILLSDLIDRLGSIAKAREDKGQHFEVIQADGQKSLDEIEALVYKQQEEATFTHIAIQNLRSRIYQIGWYRYFEEMRPPQILDEIEEMTTALSLRNDVKYLGAEEDSETNIDNEDLQRLLGEPLTLVEGIENKHYSPIRRYFQLPTASISEERLKDLLSKYLEESLFINHIEALENKKHPKGEALKIIRDTTERLFRQAEELKALSLVGASIVKTTPVSYLSIPVTEITRELFNNTAFSPVTNEPLLMYKGNGNKPVNIFYSTSFEDVEGVTGADNLSLEEEGICNAIYSLYMAGNLYVTNQMIKDARNKLGGKSKKRITEKEDKRYTDFITRAKYITISIDQRAYAEAKGLPQKGFDGELLDLNKAYDVNINGTIVKWCWHINKAPIINVHADIIGQQLSLPVEVVSVDIPAEHLPLRDYLIKEVYRISGDPLNTETETEKEERLKAEEKKRAKALSEGKTYRGRKRKQHPVILFSTIYETVYGSQNLRKDKKQNIEKYAKIILEGWKRLGRIKNYELQYEGLNRPSKKREKNTSLLADAIKIDVTKTELLEG